MADNNWLNRSNKTFIVKNSAADMTSRYGSSVDFHTYGSNAEWIYDPDMSAVTGQPKKYWITQAFPDDAVTLMDQTARDAVDADEQATKVSDSRARAIAAGTTEFTGDVTEATQLRAIIQVISERDNYNTNRIIELQAQMAAIVATTGNSVQSVRDAVVGVNNSTTNTRNRAATFVNYEDIINSGQADS